MKKEAQAIEKATLAKIPDCSCAKSLELGLALATGPLGNLVAEKADRPKELTWRAGKALLEEGISRYT